MKKLIDIDNSDGSISVYIDNIYSKEIYCDGVIDAIEFPNTIKIRFYTNTGLLENNRIVVEHNASLVLSNSCNDMLKKLLFNNLEPENVETSIEQDPHYSSNDLNDKHIPQNFELVHRC